MQGTVIGLDRDFHAELVGGQGCVNKLGKNFGAFFEVRD